MSELHKAGKLHRDIKPPNVLVTLEGRVVLLDFGLTADLESIGAERQVVGTVGHMAPEQAAGDSVSTASDWYSVGVILFEAMTGQLPFAGTPHEVLAAKQKQSAPSPDALVDGLPPDLVRLCVALLDRDASRRPGGRDVIALLGGQLPEPDDQPEPARAFPLIGRSRHRQVLDGGLAALHRRKTVSLFVFGRTGTGKTTLVRSFLDELLEREEAVVLSGRCYERESVPYKALDSLIDSLARYLKELPLEQAERLLPDDVGFLARAFPVLQSLEAIAGARLPPEETPDQQELRRRTFAGLRELLKRLAERTPLILAIDDLQWGDVDSAHLLAELICADQRPALLFIGCFRAEDADQNPFLLEMRKAMAKEPKGLDHRELAVEELSAGRVAATRTGASGTRRCRRLRRRTWSRPNQPETRCSSTSWSGISRTESRSSDGKQSANSTSTRCSGRGLSGSRRTPCDCWAWWRCRAGRFLKAWPSRLQTWELGRELRSRHSGQLV